MASAGQSPLLASRNFLTSEGETVSFSDLMPRCYQNIDRNAINNLIKKDHHFDRRVWEIDDVNKSINHIFAENLKCFMEQKGFRQRPLADKSGVAQSTISNYLDPDKRHTGKTGKAPSAKLTEIDSLAAALGVPAWVLLRPGASNQTGAVELNMMEVRQRKHH